jgi:ADP-ribose pyrophosphatase YjhB (NUDIX family)
MSGSDRDPAPNADLNRWSEALTAIAQTGLAFTENSFEAERYAEILAISADIKSVGERRRKPDDHQPDSDQYVEGWLRAVNSRVSGYVTPKVAVGAAVADGAGRLLLIQRSDSGVWLYPTGWADVGYSAAEVAIKEVHEETGIHCQVVRPIAIFDGLRAGFSRVPLYSIVFLCRAVGGELNPHPQECLDVGWFARHEIPEPVANFDLWGDHTFDSIEGKTEDVFYDAPRAGVWLDG